MQIKATIAENLSFVNILVTMHGMQILLVSIPMFTELNN